MTTLELASLILSAEFALVSAGVLFVVRRRQRHSEQTQSKELQTAVQVEASSRREALTKLFRSNANLKGRQLTITVDQFMTREQAFYDAMLNIYMNREGKSLKDIPDELRKVLTPWTELQANTSQESADIGDLRAENAQLTAQLEHNKDVIQRLLEEYDASFNKFKSEDGDGAAMSSEVSSVTSQAAEESLDEPSFDHLNAMAADSAPKPQASSEVPPERKMEEELILTQDEDAEELADLFDSVPVNGKK